MTPKILFIKREYRRGGRTEVEYDVEAQLPGNQWVRLPFRLSLIKKDKRNPNPYPGSQYYRIEELTENRIAHTTRRYLPEAKECVRLSLKRNIA